MVHWPDADFNLTYITRTELNTRRSDKPVGCPTRKEAATWKNSCLSPHCPPPYNLWAWHNTPELYICTKQGTLFSDIYFFLIRRNMGGINQRNVKMFENEGFISLQVIRLVGMDGMQSKTLASNSTTTKRPGMKHNPCAGQRKRL